MFGLQARKADLRFIDYLEKKYGLSKDQRRELHEAISRRGLSREEIEEEARWISERDRKREEEHLQE